MLLEKKSKFVHKTNYMYTEARKIHLIEEVLKVNNEATLIKLEDVLKGLKIETATTKKKKPSIYDFVGIINNKEANEMTKAINETCETINADDWK
jgi:hypothetical protein